MPFNILLTFIIGTAIGWLLVKITKAPQHLRGLILSCCAAGNVGHLPLIVVPAICREKGSPFGAPDICHTYGTAYASLSMAIGAIYLWSFVYNVVRVSSAKVNKEVNGDDSTRVMKSTGTGGMPSPTLPDQQNYTEPLLPSKNCSISVCTHELSFSCAKSKGTVKVSDFDKIWQYLRIISRKLNLKAIFAPSTTAALARDYFVSLDPEHGEKVDKLLIGSSKEGCSHPDRDPDSGRKPSKRQVSRRERMLCDNAVDIRVSLNFTYALVDCVPMLITFAEICDVSLSLRLIMTIYPPILMPNSKLYPKQWRLLCI
ncbi:hypothetical protein F383_24041 [Gossypium arboreum]|uniref:Protein PIN-LIKES 3-like n=1 Tax=Gossypium arboreum TaxID=29729 RepID=A0A0B0MSD8_GOSAR|nr:hypothetical protein F383_24041 [Gossypium arboreum]